MKITFCGAAGEVTGSQHLLETSEHRVLLDCGLFQGHRAECRIKNQKFKCGPKNLDAVILSHAHIDHCGNLPGLVKAGFDGPIFCTPATADVAALMLRDSAKIQAEDARYLQRHQPPGSRLAQPLYTDEDARETARLFEPLPYGEWHELSSSFQVRFSDAGHILGSAIVEMNVVDKGETKRVVFTGDLGRRGLPLLHDPTLIEGCDVLISESTYGDRLHPPVDDIKGALLRIITDAANNGGRVIIPAFALGRTQQLVYLLNELTVSELLPRIPVFVDSPLSMKVTEVFRQHGDVLDSEAQRILKVDPHLFDFPGLTYIESVQESQELNYRKGPFVVIASSGMCESGRVLHHLKHAVGNPLNTIVMVGFQGEHTLGRRIADQNENVRIFDRFYLLRARVEQLQGLSGHADAEDFRWWYKNLAKTGGIGQAFLVHGEHRAASALAHLIRNDCNEDPIIPQLYDTFSV